MNKRGIQLAIHTIILIALGILVLMALIFLLFNQTSFFSDFLENFKGKTNVDEVILVCNSLVESEQSYAYCCEEKKIVTASSKFNLTCDELREKDFGGRVKDLDCSEVGCE